MIKGLTTRFARGTEFTEGVNVLLFAGRFPEGGMQAPANKMVTPSVNTKFNKEPGGLRAFSDRPSPRSERIYFLCDLCGSVVNSLLASGNNLMHSVIIRYHLLHL